MNLAFIVSLLDWLSSIHGVPNSYENGIIDIEITSTIGSRKAQFMLCHRH